MNGFKEIVKKYIGNFQVNYARKSFIISTGRTGTKFMEKLFSSSNDVNCIHEYHLDDQMKSVNFLKGHLKEKEFLNFYKISRFRLLWNNRNRVFVESNPHILFGTPAILKKIKRTRLALVIRNPKSFVRSGCNRTIIDRNGDVIKTYSIEDNWTIKAYEFDSKITEKDWNEMEMAKRFIWVWNFKNSLILDVIKKSESGKVFRFEDLFTDYDSLREFVNFTSYGKVEISKEDFDELTAIKVNLNKVQDFPDYIEWSDELKNYLNSECRDLMLKFNYLNE